MPSQMWIARPSGCTSRQRGREIGVRRAGGGVELHSTGPVTSRSSASGSAGVDQHVVALLAPRGDPSGPRRRRGSRSGRPACRPGSPGRRRTGPGGESLGRRRRARAGRRRGASSPGRRWQVELGEPGPGQRPLVLVAPLLGPHHVDPDRRLRSMPLAMPLSQ